MLTGFYLSMNSNNLHPQNCLHGQELALRNSYLYITVLYFLVSNIFLKPFYCEVKSSAEKTIGDQSMRRLQLSLLDF